jgi:fimbrial isopeptide formation D2 family protein/uncharacterized repeat protein (TIGR01451 family)
VEGKYENTTEVEDTDELSVTAEDLAIQKTVSPATIANQEISKWTFAIETSEYRYSRNLEITDLLPNGLCPLGAENFEGPTIGGATEPKAECDPVAGQEPKVEAPTAEAAPYSSVEELTTGGFEIHWDASSAKALELMPPSTTVTLSFPTRTRTDYQENYEDKSRILTGDHWVNEVDLSGADYARCTPSPGETCDASGTPIFHLEPNGTTTLDDSAAEQKTGSLEIEKSVRQNDGLVPVECKGEYVDGIKTVPLYGPGDEICWQLKVEFDSNLFSGDPVVTDFLPPGQRFLPGSVREGPENTVVATPEEGEASAGILKWTMNGGNAVEFNNVFEWRFATEVLASPSAFAGDISGNLMKFSYANTAGETFPLRDRAEVERAEPELSIRKGIAKVNGVVLNGGVPVGKESVAGGDEVEFEVDLHNAGNIAAQQTEVWDVLPAGMNCVEAEVHEISNAGKCEGEKIVWQGVVVPPGEEGVALTYLAKVPTDVAPGHSFVNKTGVTHYKTPTNTAEEFFEYTPEDNIDPAATEPNTGPLLAEAELVTEKASLKKAATTETQQEGNVAGQATIGELVDYEVKATLPAGSTLYGSPLLKDEAPANLSFIAGSAEATLNGGELPVGVVLTETANGATVAFPETYEVGEEVVVVLKFKARVKDIAANVAGVKIVNSASLEFHDKAGVARPPLTAKTETPVVEPHIEVKKKNLLPAAREGTVEPGETVPYETEVTNRAGASTANDVRVVDTIPDGMQLANAGTGTQVGNTIVWEFATIAPGETKHLTYELQVKETATAAASFRNVAVATTQSLPDEAGGEAPPETRDAESKEGTFEAAKDGYESEAEDTVRLIGASVLKEVTPEEGTIGTELTYTLHMTLPANINFFDTTVVDTLPSGVEFDELLSAECVEGCGPTPRQGTPLAPVTEGGAKFVGWYFGNFAAGPERKLEVRFTAYVRSDARGGGEVEAGDVETNKVVGLYDDIEKGEPAETPIPGPTDGFSEQTNESEAHTDVAEPNLTLAKSVTGTPALGGGPPPAIAQPGTKLTYTLTVTNTGGWDAFDAEVTDTNPTANLENITPVEGALYLTSSAPLTWVIPKIEAGKSVTLTYTAELPAAAQLTDEEIVANRADVPSYFGLSESELNTANAERKYIGEEATKNLEVELPLLEVTKTVGTPAGAEAEAEIEKPLAWHIEVSNGASVAGLFEVDVVDTLPEGWKFVKGSTSGMTTAEPELGVNALGQEVLTWADATAELPAGATKTLSFDAVPTLALALRPGPYVNEALVSGKDLSGATASAEGAYEDEGTATANLKTPGLKITKTPDVPEAGSEAVAGESSAYSIEVENTGEAEATEVEVSDLLGQYNEYTPGSATASPPEGFVETAVEAAGSGRTPGSAVRER